MQLDPAHKFENYWQKRDIFGGYKNQFIRSVMGIDLFKTYKRFEKFDFETLIDETNVVFQSHWVPVSIWYQLM